jgi:hypothetical protein
MSDTTSQISDKFRKKRTEISTDIQKGIELMSNFKSIKESQVSMLSLRQRLLEESHILLEHISAVRRKLRSEKGKHLENISKDLQHRYQYNEKAVIIEGKTANIKETLDNIENQLAFFSDSIKTIDNILYGVKTRVEIEKALGL